MIALILKNWKFLFDVVVVLALVFLLFLWNPFNIFGGGLKLQSTANMVSQIKEIGELITAEYYGEVIATDKLHEVEIEEPNYFENLAADYYLDLKNGIYSAYTKGREDEEEAVEKYKSEKKRARKLARGLLALKGNILKGMVDSLYSGDNYSKKDKTGKIPLDGLDRDVMLSMLLYVSRHEQGLNPKVKKFVKSEDKVKPSRFVKTTLRSMLSKEYDNIQKFADGSKSFGDYLNQGFTTTQSFQDFYYDYLQKGESKKERKKSLAIIGRGSVKAGFRFGELNDQNFIYDETRKVIHFYGFKAEILNQDINPWFIPERKVPGFDILLSEGDITFEEMKDLKSNCIKLLANNAKKAGILEQAQSNGEEALKAFFGLLMDEEIKEVVFHQGVLTYQSDEILKDGIIDLAELDLIESLYQRNLRSIKEEENPVIRKRKEKLLTQFISELRVVDKVEGLEGKKLFNFFNRHIPILMADTMITKEELPILEKLRHNPVNEDSLIYQPIPKDWMYWFNDSLEYLTQYNLFLEQLHKNENGFTGYFDVSIIDRLVIDPTTMDPLNISDSINAKLRLSETKLYVETGDSLVVFYKAQPMNSLVMPYPIQADSLWINFVKSDTLHHWFRSRKIDPDLSTYTTFTNEGDSSSAFMDNILFHKTKLNSVSNWNWDDSILNWLSSKKYNVPVYSITKRPNGNEALIEIKGDSLFILTDYESPMNIMMNDRIDNFSKGNSIDTKLAVKRDIQIGYVYDNKYMSCCKTFDSDNIENKYLLKKSEKGVVYWQKMERSSPLIFDGKKVLLKGSKIFEVEESLSQIRDSVFMAFIETKNVSQTFIRNQLEIIVIRGYLKKKNQEYHNIGPIRRARRNMDKFINRDSTISSTVKIAKKKVSEWSNDIRNSY